MAIHAEKDLLTGLSLRKPFLQYLDETLLDSRLKKKYFSIAFFDLDKFKRYNDTYSHDCGDQLLRYVASNLRLSFQKNIRGLCRYGGDEFVILLPETGAKEAVKQIAQFKRNMASRPFLYKNKLFKVRTSCGISIFPKDSTTRDGLIKKADSAMYFSKKHGRNLIVLAGKIHFLHLKYFFTRLLLLAAFIGSMTMLSQFEPAKKMVMEKLSGTDIISKIPFFKKIQYQDTITLKNGNVMEGTITEETDTDLVLSMKLAEGRGSIYLKKSEISDIQRGRK
ncbi:MAG: GGDEF domain-containing protein [Candidatus Omnitrophica bacterium]|nr:GGDEF domain-containing protein [Candidatus Omnitrophota bacterium]MDD5487811.1 GGDEF domain-containing protein [Candidatus Omnitrophota bacterium]